jgi:hypothetical protein
MRRIATASQHRQYRYCQHDMIGRVVQGRRTGDTKARVPGPVAAQALHRLHLVNKTIVVLPS